jgi:hypothetical protein
MDTRPENASTPEEETLAVHTTNAPLIIARSAEELASYSTAPSVYFSGYTSSFLLSHEPIESGARTEPDHALDSVRLHNPMLAFWDRAILYFTNVFTEENIRSGSIRFEHYALIISDLGQSLAMLLGRHWNDKAKDAHRKVHGTEPRADTPDIRDMITKRLPNLGLDLPDEDADLWHRLDDFVDKRYNDLIKHFSEDKFRRCVSLTPGDLVEDINTVRRVWIWFISRTLGVPYDPKNPAFAPFATRLVAPGAQ